MTVLPDRLALLDTITLDHGCHKSFTEGACAMEVVSWLADEGFTDAPTCASPVLRRYTIELNDRWDDDRRQALKQFLVRMIGTGGDGKDETRELVASRFLLERLLEPWLRLAGMDEQADQIPAVLELSLAEQRRAIGRWRDAAYSLRRAKLDEIKAVVEPKIREALVGKPAVAVAVAADVAAAVAVAAAAAVDAAVAAAAAVDAAVAAAVAAAVDAAAAAAVDAAVAAAAAVDAAVAADAAAAAAAAADFNYASDGYWAVRNAAYKAARKYYDEHPLPITVQAAELAKSQSPLALELLDAMIDPDPRR